MPQVTVLMPAYNVGKYIKEAIESVLNQTFTDFELLIVDDRSSDDTVEVVQSFTDKRIRLEINEHNLGLADNLNKGIDLSETEFIARMDGDDIAEPNWLAEEYAVLSKHPEIDICGAGFQFFGTKTSKVIYPANHEEIKVQMMFGCPVIVPMFRRRSIVDNGFCYKTSAFPAEDYMMWVECIQKLKFYNIQKVLFHYRMHETQITTSKRQWQNEKGKEVILSLLRRIAPELSENENHYFINCFIGGDVSNIDDVKLMEDFVKKLLIANSQTNYLCQELFSKNLNHYLSQVATNYIITQYYKNGYSLKSYLLMRQDYCAKYLCKKTHFKIILKSILNRKS